MYSSIRLNTFIVSLQSGIHMASFKKALFAQFTLIAKAMNSAKRLEIIEFLAQREFSVEDLSKVMQLSIANTSHHLQQLRHCGLVTTRKQGQHVFYQLNGKEVIQLLSSLRTVTVRHLTQVDTLINTYLTSKDDMEAISREELLSRANKGSITALDVRPENEYLSAHLPTGINIALDELEERPGELNPQQDVVTYCRGSHCVLAFEAVQTLRKNSFHTNRLQDSWPEWKLAGLPIEKNSKSHA